MSTDAATRIAKRTRIADLHLREQNWFGRAVNRTGLFIANSVDRITAFADNDRAVFFGCTASGLLRGAVYGALGTILAIAFFPTLQIGVGLFLAIAAASAVGFGIYDGQKGLEDHLNKGNPRLPDYIAEKFGAVPGKTANINEKPADALSFAQREDMRRRGVPPRER